MTTIPRHSLARSAKVASLPIGLVGRVAVGMGKRVVGRSAEHVAAEVQERTAEHLFSVLGQLKGGAMKFGQMLSVLEVALPDNMVGPYRGALNKLQEAAPPLPTAVVQKALVAQLGARWMDAFRDFDLEPAAAASIGQVHRAVWRDGREVAVKIQYPGVREAIATDLDQLARLGGLLQTVTRTSYVKPLVRELRERMVEELDYKREATTQRAFAAAYANDDQIAVPRVILATPQLLVSEWIEGQPLADVLAHGSQALRDRAGLLLSVLHFSAPARAGYLHADPHAGNFRMLTDGRLGVLDFGAAARLPDGLPTDLGALVRAAVDRKAEEVVGLLCKTGFLQQGSGLSPEQVTEYLDPILAPVTDHRFKFDRSWLQQQTVRMTDPRRPGFRVSKHLRLPPTYLLIHRVTVGTIALLCQLEAYAEFRSVVHAWLPAFAEPRTN